MRDLFKLGHISLCSQYPTLLSTAGWSSEIYLLISLLVEASSLGSGSSGFTEGFFGLKRVSLHGPSLLQQRFETAKAFLLRRGVASSVANQASSLSRNIFTPLRRDQRLWCLLELAVFPYIDTKANESYAYYTSDQPDVIVERRTTMANLLQRMRRAGVVYRLCAQLYLAWLRLFVKYFPMLRVVIRLSQVVCLTRYALGRCVHFTPTQLTSGIAIHRASASDKAEGTPSGAQRVASVAGMALSGVFIALRILEWSRGAGGGGQANPDEPRLEGSDDNGEGMSSAVPCPTLPHGRPPPGVCVVCSRNLINPSVVVVSGAVGCYVCLQNYIAANGKCPLTGQACSIAHIRRLYEG